MSSQPALQLISLGAGVQSTTMSILSAEGMLPKVDGAIFSDTGWEPAAVYAHLDRLEREVLQPAGIPLYRVSNGNIREDALNPDHRFASMPLFVKNPPTRERVVASTEPCPAGCGWHEWLQATEDVLLDGSEEVHAIELLDGSRLTRPEHCRVCDGLGVIAEYEEVERPGTRGMARRQCTKEYKLVPIKRKVRELLGYPHPTPVPRGVHVEQWIGISVDEVQRAKDSDVKYARNRFPLLELGMRRRDCERVLHEHGFLGVPKSACIGCPFHGNRQWRDLRDNHPEEWADAVAFDEEIRHGSARARATGTELRGLMYLHSSLQPLDSAPIDKVTRREREAEQLDLLDLAADQEAGVDVDGFDPELGFEDGCGPWACRSDGL